MLITTKIPLRYIIKTTWLDFAIVLVVSIITYEIYQYIDLSDMPVSITALVGTSISLVLAFKLSQSYERWWEARKIWGAIVNDSRSLIIQAKNFTSEDGKETVKRMAHRQIAWCYSLGQSLRGLSAYDNLSALLSEQELSKLKPHKNVALGLLDFHAIDISGLKKRKFITDFQEIQLNQTIVRLCDAMGKAERIKKTVFPTTYRLFLHLFIYIFVVMLSVTLAETDGIWEIPMLMMITSPFFLLEKTAYYLQDPFENRPTDIPVTAIAQTIEVNLRQLIGETELPEFSDKKNFFVM